eukprot:SAG11_NODE_5339_length_1590_cov_1.374916_3_plen_49_part_00
MLLQVEKGLVDNTRLEKLKLAGNGITGGWDGQDGGMPSSGLKSGFQKM